MLVQKSKVSLRRPLKLLRRNNYNIRIYNIENIPTYGNLSHNSPETWSFIPLMDKTIDVLCTGNLHPNALKLAENSFKAWMHTKNFTKRCDLSGMQCFHPLLIK